ncbi:MAG: riboflavin synthase [Pseudomonadota bacterium]
MFTGIIQAVGRVAAVESRGNDARLRIDSDSLPLADARPGDSIAVNGVCLTAIEFAGQSFTADVSAETLSCTTLGKHKIGAAVNLEPALLPTTRLGGHLVSGHVDGVGRLLESRPDGRSQRLRFELPAALAKYVAAKGSICVDGISLTVNAVEANRFDVNIVPHTLASTTLAALRPGDEVNIEVDLLARYLERLRSGDGDQPTSGITPDFLKRTGFIA